MVDKGGYPTPGRPLRARLAPSGGREPIELTPPGQRVRHDLQVLGERLTLLDPRLLAGCAQDGRGMDGGGHDRRELRVEKLTAVVRQPEGAPEQGFRRGRAEQYERLRAHDPELLVQPRPARIDLEPLRRLMDPPASPLLELEVLDDVRDVDVVSGDPHRAERPVQLAAGRPDERAALLVLLIAGLLAHEH